jgi:hypothetical protein
MRWPFWILPMTYPQYYGPVQVSHQVTLVEHREGTEMTDLNVTVNNHAADGYQVKVKQDSQGGLTLDISLHSRSERVCTTCRWCTENEPIACTWLSNLLQGRETPTWLIPWKLRLDPSEAKHCPTYVKKWSGTGP